MADIQHAAEAELSRFQYSILLILTFRHISADWHLNQWHIASKRFLTK